MRGNCFLSEVCHFVPAFSPQDINGAGVTGRWVNMANVDRATLHINEGAHAGGTPNITLEQATTSGGAGAKSLVIDRAFQSDLDVTDVLAASTIASGAVAETNSPNMQYVIEIRAVDLDINNGFKWVRVKIASPGANSVIPSGLWILGGMAYASDPTRHPTAL